MTTLTITRALKEAKTIEERISKLNCTTSNFAGYLVVGPSDLESTNRKKEVDKFKSDANSNYQSVNDLMKRRDKIKSLIILSNATKTVVINGETFTVAEAIEKKKSIIIQEQLLRFMRKEQQQARDRLERELVEYNRKLESYLTNAKNVEKQTSNKEPNDEWVAKTTKSYADANYPKIYEPFDFAAEIAKLDDYITKFKDEVDITLSEANATNTIEID